mmetsp:Transcript_30443/g.78968  ORF Transcript_30443/g.78968 Transcript_30443/m.78968 type:complete len:220 (+) Transcript_30443:1999-2658(+)
MEGDCEKHPEPSDEDRREDGIARGVPLDLLEAVGEGEADDGRRREAHPAEHVHIDQIHHALRRDLTHVQAERVRRLETELTGEHASDVAAGDLEVEAALRDVRRRLHQRAVVLLRAHDEEPNPHSDEDQEDGGHRDVDVDPVELIDDDGGEVAGGRLVHSHDGHRRHAEQHQLGHHAVDERRQASVAGGVAEAHALHSVSDQGENHEADEVPEVCWIVE